ncbi:ROK family protein [Algoriphagus namhaensis]
MPLNKIGVDIGGSHIKAAQVVSTVRGFEFVSEVEDSVDTLADRDQIIASWVEVLKQVGAGNSTSAIGISFPGPFDYKEGVSLIRTQGKMKSLYGLSIKSILSQKLGVSTDLLTFTNDAEAFLRGECLAMYPAVPKNILALTLGTGLGSAFKVGEVVKDARLWAAPFREGIAEDYLGTGWFVKSAQEQFDLEIKGVIDLLQPTIDQNISEQIFRWFGRALGEFIFPYVTRLQIDRVILGGKVAGAANRFLPYTQHYLRQYACDPEFQMASLGDRGALIGALHLHFPGKL